MREKRDKLDLNRRQRKQKKTNNKHEEMLPRTKLAVQTKNATKLKECENKQRRMRHK